MVTGWSNQFAAIIFAEKSRSACGSAASPSRLSPAVQAVGQRLLKKAMQTQTPHFAKSVVKCNQRHFRKSAKRVYWSSCSLPASLHFRPT
jgi:hypothetical protein